MENTITNQQSIKEAISILKHTQGVALGALIHTPENLDGQRKAYSIIGDQIGNAIKFLEEAWDGNN